MARLDKKSRHLITPVMNRFIYADDTTDLGAAPVRIDRVFNRRYTTWAGVPGTFEHVVSVGETLPHIALRYYGNPRLWYVLADFNALETFYPLELEPKTVLNIPPASFVGETRSLL